MKPARKEFLREILYKNTFGDFSHTFEWNSLESVWEISLYISA